MKIPAFSLCCLILGGFSALKGADGDADPKHPNPLEGWMYVERVGGDLTLVLKGTQEPYNVHITREAAGPDVPRKKLGFFVEDKAGDLFGLERTPDKKRFEFKEFRHQVVADPVFGQKDQSLMVVYDRVLKEKLDLFYNMPIKVPDSKAKLKYRKGNIQKVIEVSLNDVVHLPDENDPTYRVIDILENQVIFSPAKDNGTVDETVKIPLVKAPDPAPEAATGPGIPPGIPVPGMPGYVTSPYAPNLGTIDVRDITPGTKVRDPYTGKVFLVP